MTVMTVVTVVTKQMCTPKNLNYLEPTYLPTYVTVVTVVTVATVATVVTVVTQNTFFPQNLFCQKTITNFFSESFFFTIFFCKNCFARFFLAALSSSRSLVVRLSVGDVCEKVIFRVSNEWVSDGLTEWLSEWENEWMSEWVTEWLSDWTRPRQSVPNSCCEM